MAFSIPAQQPLGPPALRGVPSIAGGSFANPKADAINKKRKKYQQNPSMSGLKAAASSSPKPFNSEGKPGAGGGGNL
jgi:hypothetical protein